MIQDYQQIFDEFGQFLTTLELFRDHGLTILFLWAITPSLFAIPDEFFMIPLVALGISYQQMFLAVSVGNLIGFLALYYLGHHAHILLRGKRGKKMELRADHWLHRYKHIVFFLVPFASLGGDAIMIYAGIKHIPLKSFWYILIPATFVRGGISILFFMGILTIF
jgi:membrane protein YqaA with SNARE-associated domain